MISTNGSIPDRPAATQPQDPPTTSGLRLRTAKPLAAILASIALLGLPWLFVLAIGRLTHQHDTIVFSANRFLEEAYKLIGAFAVMLIGFRYAEHLLRDRLFSDSLADLDAFCRELRLLLAILEGLPAHSDPSRPEHLHTTKELLATMMDLLRATYDSSRSVRLTLQGPILFAYQRLNHLSSSLFLRTGPSPIDLSVLDVMRSDADAILKGLSR